MNELQPVDTAGASGRDCIAAVKTGRLWFKVLRIDLDPVLGPLIAHLYGDLREQCTGFNPLTYSAVLLLGSTGSQVYYHVDSKPNMLAHFRGKKRFWLYPPCDFSLIDQRTLEDIYENVQDEEVPYRSAFDEKAKVFDLGPGDLLSWPHNSPHRIEVLDGMSVSISTFYETTASARRASIYGMNRLLRKIGVRNASVAENGPLASIKSVGYRVARRAGMVPTHPNRMYQTDLRIGLSGVEKLPAPTLTEFAKGGHMGSKLSRV